MTTTRSATTGVGTGGLRALLAPGALRAVVQPIVRLADGQTIGYEALARAVDPQVPGSPDTWFAIAAVEGWSSELEAACLRAVIDLGDPPDERLLFVNVLPRHLASPDVVAVRPHLPGRLVIELTEQEALDDVDTVRHNLAAWTGDGVRVALDDVGSGYAGLRQVVHLQPEFLKLDRSLIEGIDHDTTRQALVAALLGFGRQVGTTIIAEGVETHSELRWLRDAGVPLAQGFHFARPDAPWPDRPQSAVDLDRRAHGAEALARRLASAFTAGEACEVVADELFNSGGLMPSVYLESAGRLRCRAQRGLWQVLDGMHPGAGVTGRTFRYGESVVVPDVKLDPTYLEAIPGVVSEYCTPIQAGDSVVGVLNVESRDALDADTLHEVDVCARLLGDRLGELPGEPVVPLRRLGRTAATLVAASEPAVTALTVVTAACELVGTDSGAVIMFEAGQAQPLAARGPLADVLGSIATEDAVRLVELLDPLTSCYSSGDATGLAFDGGDHLRAAGACAVVALPLQAGPRRSGLLLLAHSQPLVLGPDVIEPAELLATLAGSCLENAAHLQAVERRALFDPLTGLANHACFHEALRGLEPDDVVAVAMFDVDDFKLVNDTRGHLFGDELLAATARAVASCLPAEAALYRVGGDEFAAMMPPRPVAVLESQVAVLVAAAGGVLGPHGAGLSAGIAVRRAGEDPIDALRRADEALYEAKRAGGGVRS